MMCRSLILLLLLFFVIKTNAQVFVDDKGVMRDTKTRKEVSYFGVNYTAPFAHAYRAHKALGLDLEKAIDMDVHHLSRLGINAFRVHVWDTEISDTNGNLIENDHLRLYDYLLMKLKQHNIKILFTPLAYWGNGYPDKNEETPGFSHRYNKRSVLVEEKAVKAQENYLRQILKHINPYTKLTYGDDPDVIALEINNEPHHSGSKAKVAEYVSRMVTAVRSSGWKKPVFYNISESPSYADVVAASDIQGVSFQWYPTGLVSNHEQKGNFLPHVDAYTIPFGDTIPKYKNKALAVYEFDAGDVFSSYMYPAMARSFRTAGFQWATQFAYDPLAIANVNTEYQTHYLNLVYTPSKAISLLIASRVFQMVPRLKSYGKYPADTLFDVFQVSHRQSLSQMNSETEFYYSNSTTAVPKNIKKLEHIAGVGSSAVVRYEGTGAYFLDRLDNGSWRFEAMPDVVYLSDPFNRTSANKKVAELKWESRSVAIDLPGVTLSGNIQPGVYLISNGPVQKVADPFIIKPPMILKEMIREKEATRDVISTDKVELYSTEQDRQMNYYTTDWSNTRYTYFNTPDSVSKALRIWHNADKITGFQSYFKGWLKSVEQLDDYKTLVVEGRSEQPGLKMKITLITADGAGFSTVVETTDKFSITRIPLSKLIADQYLLLPRPYPGFLPLYFKSASLKPFAMVDAEKIEVSFEGKGTVEIKSVFVER